MKFTCRVFLLLIILLACVRNVFAQANTTNKGTEFWTAYMEHNRGIDPPNGSRMVLYITSDINTSGTVSLADGSFSTNYNVSANNVTTVEIPSRAYIVGQGQFYKGIHVTALKPVAVYAHSYATSVSGATLLLPVSTLGKDYFSINYTQKSNSESGNQPIPAYSTFAIIGTEDKTVVSITPTKRLFNGQPAGAPFTISLRKGEVYEARSSEDLTGTRITSVSINNESCKKIAVFSGSTKIGIGCDERPENFSSDNLFQQAYPISTWGKNYISAPLSNRAYDIYRIMFSEPGTKVTVNGQIPVNKEGIDGYVRITPLYIEFTSTQTNVIKADKPVQVAQYAVTQNQKLNCITGTGDVGDPEMIFLNPIEQNLDHVTLYSASNFEIEVHYINAVIKTAAAPTFTLDGNAVSFSIVPGTNGEYSYAQINVPNPGSHTIKAADGFNAIAYGFGEHESYGYAAGTNLKDLNSYITLKDPVINKTYSDGCTSALYNLQLVLPYQPANIEWDLKNGSPPVIDNKPVASDTLLQNGVTLYVYQYKQQGVQFAAGDHTITATVPNLMTIDNCGSDKTIIPFDFNIAEPPGEKFIFNKPCVGEITQFTDQTDLKGSVAKSWLWDFGDGTPTSALQSPTHTFAQPGTYIVKLTVTNVNGCAGNTFEMPVKVLAKPVVNALGMSTTCVGATAIYTAKPVNPASIIKWVWNFNDGTPADTTAVNNTEHKYTSAGAQVVSLTYINSNGCETAQNFNVYINTLAVADFTLPDVCVNDAFAQFTDNSTISDHTEADFTYQWDFGDINAGEGEANSTLRNPKHKFAKAGPYLITLTVTSKYGCATNIQKTLVVASNDFLGGVVIQNKDDLCSSEDVVFKIDTRPNIGEVSKVEWFFDLDADPNAKETIEKNNLPADGIFRHNYGSFNTPVLKKYRVKLRVYAGGCFNEYGPYTITVYANPIVTLSPASGVSICQTDDPITFTEDKHGFTGQGSFAGKGISADGRFDPKRAGPGLHEITYTFVSEKGCDYVTTFNVVVNLSPIISVKPRYTIYEGESVILDAQILGVNPAFKWSPATGLSSADVLQPEASPADDITYTLKATLGDCSDSVEVLVNVLRRLSPPNVFTPNGDGVNDTWRIAHIEDYPNCIISIFSRKGDKIFSSIGYGVAWDGTRNGTRMPDGAYYYIIDLKDGRKPITGHVSILK